MPQDESIIDPRVKALMQGRQPYEAFLIGALAMNMEPERLSALIEHVAPSGAVDFSSELEGKPVRQWMGLSVTQIQNVTGDAEQTARVVKGLQDRGLQVDEAEPVFDPAAETEDTASRLAGGGSDAGSEDSDDDGGDGSEVSEPVFGPNRVPLSEFRNLDDSAILAMDGIGAQTLAKIRESLKELQA